MSFMHKITRFDTDQPCAAWSKGHWWLWAAQTPVAQKAFQALHIPIVPARPWEDVQTSKSAPDDDDWWNEGWRAQPWVDEGELTGNHDQFDGAITAIRAVIREPLAGVFFCERYHKTAAERRYSDPTFIAVSRDGTRVVALQPRPA